MTQSKRAAVIVLFAAAGALAGLMFGRFLPNLFPGAPVWLFPAIVIGIIAVVLAAALTRPAVVRLKAEADADGH